MADSSSIFYPASEAATAGAAHHALPPSAALEPLSLEGSSHAPSASAPGDDRLLAVTQAALAGLSLTPAAYTESQLLPQGVKQAISTQASSQGLAPETTMGAVAARVLSPPLPSSAPSSPHQPSPPPWELYDAVQIQYCNDDLLRTHYRIYPSFTIASNYLSEPHRIVHEQRTALVLFNPDSDHLEVRTGACKDGREL